MAFKRVTGRGNRAEAQASGKGQRAKVGQYKSAPKGGYKSKWQKPEIVKEVQNKLVGSPQQEAFWKRLLEGTEHLVLQALAGTGKTTTLVQGLLRLEERGLRPKTALLAFNKSIAEELQRKVPVWATAGTMHSLGYAACRANLGKPKVTGWKLDNLVDAHFPEVETDEEFWMVKKAAKTLVGLCKNNLVGIQIEGGKTVCISEDIDKDIRLLIEKHNVDTFDRDEEVVTTTKRLLKLSREKTFEIDFDDMLWLPIVNNWRLEQYELLMVDESQDLNPVQQETVMRMAAIKTEGSPATSSITGRVVIVGDINQAIYAFRGADGKSMETMTNRLGEDILREVKTLPLTFTRRCPKQHVALARSIVTTFENFPDAPEGKVENMVYSKMLCEVQPGDMMLCRMNAPLCLTAFRLLRANIPVKIQGKDFGGELESLILKLAEKNRELPLTELEDRLEKFHSIESEKLGKRRNPEMALEILEDKVTCIRLLGEGLSKVSELCERIKSLFEEVCSNSGAKRQFVLLSSVHRAKGLEAEGVFILQPWLMPHPRATTAEDQEQERNIRFVALTRSKNRLVLEYREE